MPEDNTKMYQKNKQTNVCNVPREFHFKSRANLYCQLITHLHMFFWHFDSANSPPSVAYLCLMFARIKEGLAVTRIFLFGFGFYCFVLANCTCTYIM